MSSPPSPSKAFDRLHPEVQRWIWEKKWQALRDIQDRAILAILDGKGDVLISASTAAGKTEAAFLPILTAIKNQDAAGLSVLCVSPLKALINDQFQRLDLLCERLEIPVVRWHGDAPQGAKKRTIKEPRGVAIITPESIEALFVRKPAAARKLFGSLRFVVIDELHAFLQGPRGLHLSSLLTRINELNQSRPRRIGLSATIGDLSAAARWMNWRRPEDVFVLESSAEKRELQLQIRGYEEPPPASSAEQLDLDHDKHSAIARIAAHMFERFRGENNLVFGGRRIDVEVLADRLRQLSDDAAVPNEFFAHHGSISKGLREDLEARLRKGDLPTTAVATSTLELGIDLGSVRSVAQYGAPRSISSLKQRLGRSGRREGSPSILRIYASERFIRKGDDPIDQLRLEIVRAVAAVRLLIRDQLEPPAVDSSTATVVLHQTLSVITERGGERADKLYRAICGAGPLSSFSTQEYARLLRHMAHPDVRLIEQAPDGAVMLGELGEKIVDGRSFYAVFPTDQEWRLIYKGEVLGTLPLSNIISVGSLILFAGRRWRVVSVDDRGNVLDVTPHKSARLPKFESAFSESISDEFVAEMRTVLRGVDEPPYLDKEGMRLLAEARAAYREFELDSVRILGVGRDTHLFLWRGTARTNAFAVALQAAGLECEPHDLGVTLPETAGDEARAIVQQVSRADGLTAQELSGFVENIRSAKYDDLISDEILRNEWRKRNEPSCCDISKTAKMLI
ncbi:DEAD/DEAH box helicase [Hyphococcus flavus]|uniref:DEAD/DEAH box helicase n=1 Tax=Hyphococcus flavus TaxID=1866326 RepID=A0AAF0CEV5_9PROT|nr:DEAD/DEAH box helicase [Hyphococcus flavus]WDI31871.1 DEAD/DEAH box helicase [Hyphococcus flavus]